MNTHKISVKGQRIGAAIIDVIVLNFINFVAIAIFSVIGYNIRYSNNTSYILVILLLIFPLLLNFLYYTLFPYLTKGKTISKMLLGIKIVNYEYKRPSFLQLLFRNFYLFTQIIILIIMLLTLLGDHSLSNTLNLSSIFTFAFTSIFNFFVCLVILIMILATEDEQGLHDMIAKTYVVHKQFDIDKFNELNALERRDMDWADFGEPTSTQNKETNIDQINNDDDEIELLKKE